MEKSSRTRRNVIFGLLLGMVTVTLLVTRLGSSDEDPPKASASAEDVQTGDWAPSADASEGEAEGLADAPPPDASLSFAEYDEQYEALRDSFRGRDSLTALIEGHRVAWEGYLRNVNKQTSAFYISVQPQPEYSGTSALVTFDHAFEEQLYALRPDDPIRFEGVVKRAGISVSIEGTAVERIE